MKAKSIAISAIQQDNARLIELLAGATTREPKSGGFGWVSSSPSNMRDVITFKTEGKSKGSLERFAEANKIPKKVYTALREAAAYGAHSNVGSSNGVLAFPVSKKALESLEAKLNKIYTSRDKNKDGVLDASEQAKVKTTKNGQALLAGRTALAKVKTDGLRTEHTFSRQVTRVIDLMYSKGSIQGASHIENIAKDLPAPEAEAVRAAYAAVSRYMSKGQTSSLGFICMDQRREVTRGLMRVFGATLDKTEKAISALELPQGY